MRTTLNINDALLRELKQRAHEQQRPLTQVVNEALRCGLGFVVKPSPVPELPVFALGIKPAYKAMSMNQLYDQVEAENISGSARAVAET